MASSPSGKDAVQRPGLTSRRTWITGCVALALAVAINLYVANRESEPDKHTPASPAQTSSRPSDTMQATAPAARTPQGVTAGAM